MNIFIDRWYQPDCTLGRLSFGNFKCFTLELPWNNNLNDISCIPEGKYEAFKRKSPKNGLCVELKSVKGRTNIQIHSGNYTRQIEGCILTGDSIKYLDNDGIPDVTNSRNTLDKMLALLPDVFYVDVRGDK